MRWERVYANARARETLDGKKSPGRTGGVWGPGKRWGHTCNAVRGGRFIYVFGGFYGADKCHSNDVFVFDTAKQTWSKPMVKGVPPSPRDSHSCTTVGSKLFVFGGTDGMTPLNDLHVLDTSSNTWIMPSVQGNGPDAREGHSAALVEKWLFVFGGCGQSSDDSGEVYYNDLHILNTETLVWEHAMTSGVPPSARDSHTCSSWKNKIIVLGGEDSSDRYLADVHILDTDTLSWKQISTSGQMLAPRAGHTTVAFRSNLYVFGGFTDDRNLYDDLHVLNVDTGIWSRVITENQGPSARFSVAGDCLDEHRGILVFMGGCNKSLEALDDMYYLSTDGSTVNGLLEQRPERFSLLKKDLKKKCQEDYLPAKSSEKIYDGTKLAISSDSSQRFCLRSSTLAGTNFCDSDLPKEKTFEARITNMNQYGYALETVIDGKLLRGMLMTCTASCSNDNSAYPNKKRMGKEVESASLDKNKGMIKAVEIVHQQSIDSEKGQVDIDRGKDATVQETSASNLTGATPDADAHQPNMTSVNLVPSSSPEDLIRNEASNCPQKSDVVNLCVNPPDSAEEPALSSLVRGTEELRSSSNGHCGRRDESRKANSCSSSQQGLCGGDPAFSSRSM